MALIPFGEWLPDMPEYQNPGSNTILNCVPDSVQSYAPALQLSSVTGALTNRAQGAMFTRDNSSNVWGFAGDSTRLYKYVSGSTSWQDITQRAAAKNITAITQANPGKVTIAAHGYSNGDVVYISGVLGMTQVNNLFFTVTVVDANNFAIGVNTSAYTAYSSAGTAQKETFYSVATDERWNFVQFGERIIAASVANNLQSYVMNSSAAFADLSATAPKARYIARVRDQFVMVANTVDGTFGAVPQRVWWPAIGDPTNWPTPGTSTAAQVQSDYRDLLGDGGANQGIVGGLAGADIAVIQERAIWRAMYIGPPVIFSFAVVESARGTPAPGSIVQVGPVIYYLADDGFYSFDGMQSTPIGHQKVDNTFWADVDQNYLYRITAAVDPLNKLIYWAYPGPQNSGGTPNRIIVYNYGVGRWSQCDSYQIELMVSRSLSTGYTLEQLDPFGTLETLPFSLDSRVWTGGKLQLAAFDTNHKMGFFAGASLAATLDTSEANLTDKGQTHISRVWPMVDTSAATVAVGRRNRLADAVTWGNSVAMNATTGSAGIRSTGTFQRARVQIPAGSVWTHAQGVQFDARPAGKR